VPLKTCGAPGNRLLTLLISRHYVIVWYIVACIVGGTGGYSHAVLATGHHDYSDGGYSLANGGVTGVFV
jgi:hypothetical protein